MGVNALCGSLGVAAAPAVAGLLGDASGWRAAFHLPGVDTVLIGVCLVVALVRGIVAIDGGVTVPRKAGPDSSPPRPLPRDNSRRALVALGAAMMCGSLLYSAFVTALPKWAEGRIVAAWPEADLGIVGTAVAAVFLVGGFGQVLAGYLADRYESRLVYLVALSTKPALLVVSVLLAGPAGLVAAATLVLVIDLTV